MKKPRTPGLFAFADLETQNHLELVAGNDTPRHDVARVRNFRLSPSMECVHLAQQDARAYSKDLALCRPGTRAQKNGLSARPEAVPRRGVFSELANC